MFKQAIVRTPCPEMVHGITTSNLGLPNYQLALEQHRLYVKTLASLGLDVKVLNADSRFPDSTFVEDVALCTGKMAVITSPGAITRQGEQHDLEKYLSTYFRNIEHIKFPGTLEAGDVMMAGSHFYIGISDRTNHEGAEQLIQLLHKYDMTGEKVEIEDILHLKTGISYLEENTILIQNSLINHPAFKDFKMIEVPEDELYAANSLWINGTVLVPSGFPKTIEKIKALGFSTLAINVSEFEKLDGGLSCLSLRF